MRRLGMISLAAAAFGGVSLSSAHASDVPYQAVGTQNSARYSFSANGGDVKAYYLGTGAAYDETLGLLVNGKKVASGIFEDHSTDMGASYDFGTIKKGSVLTFFIDVQTSNQTFYSDSKLNNDSANHIYSAAYAGADKVPAGTYVGFEDLSADRTLAPLQTVDVDYNYTDEQFSFTNLSVMAIPLPGSAPMFGAALLAFGGLGFARSRGAAARKRETVSA